MKIEVMNTAKLVSVNIKCRTAGLRPLVKHLSLLLFTYWDSPTQQPNTAYMKTKPILIVLNTLTREHSGMGESNYKMQFSTEAQKLFNIYMNNMNSSLK